jgi:uncharacterized tellurite resistance protein B-like protein
LAAEGGAAYFGNALNVAILGQNRSIMKVPEIENLDDFTCFLLTYVAEANYRITEGEKEIILAHVSPEKYERIVTFINNRSDYECLQLIDYYRTEFLTDNEKRTALLAEMEALYRADEQHSVLEQNMIRALRKLI